METKMPEVTWRKLAPGEIPELWPNPIIDEAIAWMAKQKGSDMLTLQRERSTDLWPEIMPLLIEHKDEVAHFADIELDPDIDAYNQCEEMGFLRCYTARLNGELIGYSINFLKPNMHYKQSLQGLQDVLFLAKAHRHGRVGVKLIRYKEEQLRAEGTQVTYEHTKANAQIRAALAALPDRTDVGALMERLGYELVDLIYAKRLDK